MLNESARWPHDSRIPAEERIRLEDLVVRLGNALQHRKLAAVAGLKVEILDLCHELQMYILAIETWENEGGK